MTATLDLEIAEVELNRFLTLCAEIGPGLSMFSEQIDEVWHRRLEDADAYVASCMALGIKPIGHVSTLEAVHPATTEWVASYEARWGLLSEAWFRNADGDLDRQARSRYLAAPRSATLPVACCGDTEWIPTACCGDTE